MYINFQILFSIKFYYNENLNKFIDLKYCILINDINKI